MTLTVHCAGFLSLFYADLSFVKNVFYNFLCFASLFHTNQRVSDLGYYFIEEAIDFKHGT